MRDIQGVLDGLGPTTSEPGAAQSGVSGADKATPDTRPDSVEGQETGGASVARLREPEPRYRRSLFRR